MFGKMLAWPATTLPAALMRCSDMTNTSAELMDRFLRFLSRFGGKDNIDRVYTSLWMAHPSRLDPYLYLGYCQSEESKSGSPFERYGFASTSHFHSHKLDVERMIRLLRNAEETEYASWAEGVLSSLEYAGTRELSKFPSKVRFHGVASERDFKNS